MTSRRHGNRHGRPPLANSVKRERRALGDPDAGPSLFRHLALTGSLGWLIVLPMLAGVALGRWLDAGAGGGVMWTGAGVAAGAALGGWLAWKRMHES